MTYSLTALPDTGPAWEPVGDLFVAADTVLPSIYWPWLVDMAALPIDWTGPRWRMYYSTDHDAIGGVAYATADDPAGPWTQHPVIYTDTVAGASTETPSVVYVPETGMWHLYYQQAGIAGTQCTELATSADGLTGWTRRGPVIQIIPAAGAWPGDGHTGYAVPHRLPGGRWLAYHLAGGSSHPHFGQSWSEDGLSWWIDPRPLGYGAHLTHGPLGERRVEWNSGYLVQRRDGLWWVGTVSGWHAGAPTTSKDAVIAQAPIAADLRTLLAPPAVIGLTGPSNIRAINVTTDTDGTTWMVWQDGDRFALARMVAE